MLETSYGLTYFLKSPKKKTSPLRHIYVRVTVNGIPKETSTKRRWDIRRWDQASGRATGTKEDAKTLNYFLESLETKISNYKTELIRSDRTITAECIIAFVKGENTAKNKVLEEFKEHNEEIHTLISKGEYAKGTHTRYVTALSHVQEFIRFKYKKEDLEFRELNYEFVKDYEFFLKTVKNCAHNTTLKYISNFKKIVLRAVAKEIIPKDPFLLFKCKKEKIKKKPLTKAELYQLENKKFSTERLSTIRDIFVFQCYTGLAYIDVYQLKKNDIRMGDDGKLWIMSKRQKTKSTTDIPLLPKAVEIMEKYKDHPDCISKGSVLPVKSNQKMNEYLKEIAELCNISGNLNTHRARRTFASTVTLNNGVSIHVVKEMLGHHSVKQTEDYAIAEQEAVSREMMALEKKLSVSDLLYSNEPLKILQRLEKELHELKALKQGKSLSEQSSYSGRLIEFEQALNQLKTAIGA
ncbi:site-specific integrase [Chryseobacterium gallinarum]|uniref:site-specific integrase n=1 Tax=Chryseobacterium gallinarum TaxID=1324352 RepID=UPI002025467E|nr:site-specific integrase [Chryseobacterium gallinarum]MCL8537628.1 site-specific integrase [Chryseobacterium gallinarum]